MIVHSINSIEARAELQEILAINKQVLNAQTNKPTFGLVQDALSGSYHMTRMGTFLTREQAMNLMMAAPKSMDQNNPQWTLPQPAIIKPTPLWTGKQIYALLFPSINLTKVVRNGPDNDPLDQSERYVCIRNGKLLSGALCKQTVGSTTGGLIHIIAKDHSMDMACTFLSEAQKMVNLWMTDFGFSAGISDCVASTEVEKGVQTIVRHAYDRIDYINGQLKDGVVKKVEIEEPVTSILRGVVDQTGKLAQTQMSDKNRIYAMTTAGSKGNAINLSQIIACVGQQTVDGRRLHSKNSLQAPTTLSTRTMSSYDVGDEHPETHGFCPSSYATGLGPEEFFMCAQGGREGLVDTAVKSVTGNTRLVIIEDEKLVECTIGEWIDRLLAQHPTNIVHHQNANMEYLELKTPVRIPTIDRYGNASVALLTAVTRHDPSPEIYTVTTQSGRQVSVVESKSLLVWKEESKIFEATDSKDVHVGDYLPTIFETEELVDNNIVLQIIPDGAIKQCDVFLDKIVLIKKRPSLRGEKVYDVTVPSTLNFTLANGLCVRDTSVTGYLQRRLLKAMEALQVQADSSVRNAEGYVVDFIYGGDGMDAQFLEPMNLPILKLDNAELKNQYLLSQFDEKLDPDWKQSCDEEFAKLFAIRDECRRVKKNKMTGEVDVSVLLPAHLPRLLENVWNNPTGNTRLTPTVLVGLVHELVNSVKTYAVPRGSVRNGVLFMEAAIRTYLCSSKLCVPRRGLYWTIAMVKKVIGNIERLFQRSLADRGEMVGALSSESIGEPSTQLVIFCFFY